MDTPPQQKNSDGRARSMSTNSDPNETAVSMLARFSGKRAPDSTGQATPTESHSFQFTRPPTGTLKVDTSAIDTSASVKQNKSAYPSFARDGVLLPLPDRSSQRSPAPVTAGPDLGRHNSAARREIVGYNTRTHKPTSSASSIRHSLQGAEVDSNINPSPPIPSYAFTSAEGNARSSGHVRAGSAGNWASFSRSGHVQSSYPQQTSTSSPAGDIIATSPWPSTDLTTRINEKVWA